MGTVLGVLGKIAGTLGGVFATVFGVLGLVVGVLTGVRVFLFLGGFFGILGAFLWFFFWYLDRKTLILPTIVFSVFFVVFLCGFSLVIIHSGDEAAAETETAETIVESVGYETAEEAEAAPQPI